MAETDGNPERAFWTHELEVYRHIEYWGLTLILGAVGGITYNLVGWIGGADESPPLRNAPWPIIFSPLVVGTLGAVFLRIVNFRSRTARFRCAPKVMQTKKRSGWLGRLIAAAPLVGGVAGTTLVTWARYPTNDRARTWFPIVSLAVGIIVAAIVECRHRDHWEKRADEICAERKAGDAAAD